MGKIISVVNQKGGVGKTTTAVNVTACLTAQGKRALLVDFDPQGNATSGLGVNKSSSPNVYDVIVGGVDAAKAVVKTRFGDVLPTGVSLSGAEVELAVSENREFRLRDALNPLRANYDFILIDCPPSLGLLTLNVLCASDSVLIPVQCEYYALEGLSDLTRTVKLVRGKLHPALEIEGVALTMYDARTNLSVQVASEVKRFFPGKVFKTAIPRSVRLSEAPSHGLPIISYDRGSKGADAYEQLSAELAAINEGKTGG
ncbi:sporulation initiation inhibitor protein Soj [Clostridia bacterium]|nr:sporulation initiation inhibitor protein Soj [Clostridia bacterium]